MGKSILIVEDDETSFRFMEIVLKNIALNIIWVDTGEKAIKYCEENSNIDLILMDINLPGIDGYITTAEIKKLNPNLPIIAQTAFALEGDREKTLKAGCNDYLAKPINKTELQELVKKYFQE